MICLLLIRFNHPIKPLKFSESPARIRVAEALGTDAGILALSCPTCAIMLEDAAKSSNLDKRIQIKEISEIVNER